MHLSVPIVIGTIPLRSTFTQFKAKPKTVTAPADSDKPPPYSAFGAYPDLPPPTYQQAKNLPSLTKDDSDEKYTTGNWNFKPSYPYYR